MRRLKLRVSGRGVSREVVKTVHDDIVPLVMELIKQNDLNPTQQLGHVRLEVYGAHAGDKSVSDATKLLHLAEAAASDKFQDKVRAVRQKHGLSF